MSENNTRAEKAEECLSCKIISVSTLIAIGSYLGRHGIRMRSIPYLVLGGGAICLGIGEVFGKSPFRS